MIGQSIEVNKATVRELIRGMSRESWRHPDRRLRSKMRRLVPAATQLEIQADDEATIDEATRAATAVLETGGTKSDALRESLRVVFDAIEQRLSNRGRMALASIVDAAELILLDTAVFDLLIALIFRGML